MKFNFRKIASVLASTVMLSSTVALAAAAALPAPFISNGHADVAVVYGTNPLAASTDMVAATNIQNFLSNKLTAMSGGTSMPSSGSVSTVTGGDFIELNKDNVKTEMGTYLNSVYQSLDSNKLPVVLADGTYNDNNGGTHDYKQKVVFGAPKLGFYVSNNDSVSPDSVPVFGFQSAGSSAGISSGDNILNYTLQFTDSPTYSNDVLGNTDISILGKSYYILSANASGDNQITLLDSANDIVLNSGDTKTVTIGGKSYDVSISAITGTQARLNINGVTTKTLVAGQTQKLSDGTYVGIKDVLSSSYQGGTQQVEFSLGTGELIISDGTAVKLNDQTINDVIAHIGLTGSRLNSITFEWVPSDDTDLSPGNNLLMPGLQAIQLSMPAFVTPDNETLSVQNSGSNFIELSNVNIDQGVVGSIPILYTPDKTLWAGLGKDSTHVLATMNGTNPTIIANTTVHTEFVATYASGSTFDSHVFTIDSIDQSNNDTTFTDQATGKNIVISNGDTQSINDVNLGVTVIDPKTASVHITGAGNGAYADRIVTAGGLTMMLPVWGNDLAHGQVNASQATWDMTFSETDRTKTIVNNGATFNVTLSATSGSNSKGPSVSATSLRTLGTDKQVSSGSNDYIGYVVGPHATELLYHTGPDQRTVDITYHPSEAYAQVFVTEYGASVVSSDNSTGPTTVNGISLMKDTDVSASTTNNLVVVGGSCVNSVAAQLLGLTYGADTSCGDQWQTATNVGAGSFLIQSFDRGNGKIATLVAGYNAPDTTNAAMAFQSQSIDTTVGKKYTGTTGSAVSLVTS